MPRTFHDELVPAHADGLPEEFFDRFVFNLHRGDVTDLSILMGLGVYPPKDTVDGFVIAVTASEQRNLRFSTELSATDGRSAGPFSWRVVEPMTVWHLGLAANDIGVEFDLTWRARAPAWFGDVRVQDGDEVTSSFEHLFQSGRYEGTLRVDGREEQVDGWYGQRDRSRGVRTMAGGQGVHLWFQAQFPDRSVGFLYVEDRRHERLLLEGAVMPESGELDPIVDVRHDLRFDDGLDLDGGAVSVVTAGGATYRIDVDASAGGGYMAGGGYGGHHGRVRGRDHVEHDVYPLDGSVSPRTLDSALTDRLWVFRWDGTPRLGIFEFAHTRSRFYAYRRRCPDPGCRLGSPWSLASGHRALQRGGLGRSARLTDQGPRRHRVHRPTDALAGARRGVHLLVEPEQDVTGNWRRGRSPTSTVLWRRRSALTQARCRSVLDR